MPSRTSIFASVFTFVALPSLVLSGGPIKLFPRQSVNSGLKVNPSAEGATAFVTPRSGPNGGEDWLNRGIKEGGWTAPFLHWDSLVKVSSDVFYSKTGANCRQHDGAFQASGKKYNIDPVFLAMIAMQESSCNADAGGPTPGLMQVACGNYPDGRCTNDVAKNVDAGAAYLRKQLDETNNNAIEAIGNYNGWFTANRSFGKNGGRGLTEGYPCSQEGRGNGSPQNLDYLHQTLNGWFVGLNPQGEDNWIGEYQCRGCDRHQFC